MTDQRARIAAYVERHPGVHFNELRRELDLATGQAQYHLRRLAGDDAVDRRALYGRTHYFPPSCAPWERGAIALARRETARDVLVYLVEHGPSRPAAVATGIDVARSTLEWHLDHLVEQDVVRKDRDDRNRVTLVLARPEETVTVLQTVAPSLGDALVDRFIRLTDTLFEL